MKKVYDRIKYLCYYICGANRAIFGKNALEPLRKLARRKSITKSNIYIISGSHGTEDGNNWTNGGQNASSVRENFVLERDFYIEDDQDYGNSLRGPLQTFLQGSTDITSVQGLFDITTVSGDFEISNLQGHIDLGALQGDLELENLRGPLDLAILQGSLDLGPLKGEIDLNVIPLALIQNFVQRQLNIRRNRFLDITNLQGTINLAGLQGNLNLDLLQEGSIDVTGLRGNLDLGVLTGSLDLTFLAGSIDLGLLQGRTYIQFFGGQLDPSNLQGDIDLSTFWGSAALDNLLNPINLTNLNNIFDLSNELDQVDLSSLQGRIKIIDIGSINGARGRVMTSDEFIDLITNLKGHVILAFCFGYNDEGLRYGRGEPPVTSYV